ncbi:LEA type 2 family protein [Reinekea forsetii]|nr:LEA type 2 family protein [Reinekea forsetii]
MKHVLTLIIGVLLSSCANLSLNDVYRAPTFEYQQTQITSLDWSSLKGTTVIKIRNSNPYSLPVTDIEIEIWLEGQPWLTLDHRSLQTIPASSSIDLALDWGFVYQEILSQANSAYTRGEADFSVRIKPTLNVPLLGPQSLSWQESFTLPVPKLPKVSLNRWQIDSFSFTSIDMSFGFKIENPNVFSLSGDDLGLTLLREGRALTNIGAPSLNLNAKEDTNFTSTVSLSLLDVGKTVFDGLKDKRWPDGLDIEWRGKLFSKDLGMDLPSIQSLNVGGLD